MIRLSVVLLAVAPSLAVDPAPAAPVAPPAEDFMLEVTNSHHLPVEIHGVRVRGSRRVPANATRTLRVEWRDREFYLEIRIKGGAQNDARGGARRGDVTWYTGYMRAAVDETIALELPRRFEGDNRFRRDRP